MESRSTQADLNTHGVMSVPGGPPLSKPQQQQQQRPAQVDRGSATDRAVGHHVENNARIAAASAAQAAAWPRLAEARGSLEHDLALKEASGEPDGRGLSRLVFRIGGALRRLLDRAACSLRSGLRADRQPQP